MKTFRGYLQERFQEWKKGSAPAWTESLSTMLFDLPRAGLKDVKIPLAPSILKRIWSKPVRITAFHLTDFDGVKKLKGMQKGKRSISAFFNIDDIIIDSGIKTEGGYVVELIGDVLAAAEDDISSQPDKSGRRWLTLSTLINPLDLSWSGDGLGGGAKLKGIEKDIEKLLVDIVTKHSDITPLPNINKAWGHLGQSTGGKEKSLIIKDYIDGMEVIMKKYSKSLKSLLLDYTKKRIQEPDPDSGDRPMWDELVINNFTIEKIHVSPEYADDFRDDDDIEGFPFEVYDDTGDMLDYIARVVQKGI